MPATQRGQAEMGARMASRSIFEEEPQGHYPLCEAAWIAGVRSQRLAAWVRRGHASASQSPCPPLVFCYQDIAEAILIHELLEQRRVPWRQVRDTIAALRDKHGVWPLSRESLRRSLVTVKAPSARHSSLVVQDHDATYECLGSSWQQMLNPEMLGLIISRLERGGWAVVLEPDIEHIAIDPNYLSGRPTIRGHRIAAVDVACMAATEDGQQMLRDEYRLTPEEIADAVRWWKAAQQLPAAA